MKIDITPPKEKLNDLYCSMVFFALPLFLSFSILLAGNTGKITGRVIDTTLNEPMIGANISLLGTSIGTATDLEGNFLILNVPVGEYDIRANMIGYASLVKKNIRISADLTTKIDFNLKVSAIEGETITVIGEPPPIIMDLTSSQKTVTGEDIFNLPVENVEGAVALSAGAVEENGVMHLRGGRAQETNYLFDGVSLKDPLTGNPNDSNVPMLGVGEVDIITGGFAAEYGDVQSGIINVTTREGSNQFHAIARITNSNLITTTLSDIDNEKLNTYEFTLRGPIIKDKAHFSTAGEFKNTNGYFKNQYRDLTNFMGRISYAPFRNLKIHFSGLFSHQNFQDGYKHSWSHEINEDRLTEFIPSYVAMYDGNNAAELKDGVITDGELPYFQTPDGQFSYSDWWNQEGLQSEGFTDLDSDGEWDINEPITNDFNENGIMDEESPLDYWYGNGILDTEDINFNSMLDEGEDLNNNGIIDSEDIDRNKELTTFNMFERLPWWKTNNLLLTSGITYTFSSKTYIKFTVAQYTTEQTMNIIERINEDRNYNGILDCGTDGICGTLDSGDEDLNGDGILNIYNPNSELFTINDELDMFHDENGDDIVDESYWDRNEDGVINDDDYITWDEMMGAISEGQKHYGNFYGVTANHPNVFNRDHWHNDKKVTNTIKLDFVSQVDKNNKIHTGIEIKRYDLSNHDTPDRYGYAELYNVKPFEYSFFIADKMEYKGIIVNAGLRMEYFQPSAEYPLDGTDPLWDENDIDDWDGDGDIEPFPPQFESMLGTLKRPQKAESQINFSPRLGISHPITDQSMLYFNYSRNYQRPRLDYLFRNNNFNLGGGFPIIGAPYLKPEMTVAYEIGFRSEIIKNIVLEAKGFYKDIFGLTDTRAVYWTVSDWYSTYENRDYGNVRGAELILSVRPPNIIYGDISYTYSIAKGKSSSYGQGYITTWAGGVIPTFESFLDWDQRHTLSAIINFALPNMLATFVMSYGSGTRYTKPGQGRLVVENTETLPWTFNTDFKLNYYIKIGNYTGSVFTTIKNIFDRKNIRYVADDEWYHTYKEINEAFENGDMSKEDYMNSVDLNNDGKVDRNKQYPEMGSDLNPSVYSPGRQFRIGITIDF